MMIAAPPTRRERKRHQTLEHLVSTALRLFEAHGYETVTMEQIAEATDVAKRTLYNHFPVKEAILAHWIHAQLAADLAHLSIEIERHTDFRSRASCLLDASAAWCERHRGYMLPYLRFRFMSADAAARDDDRDGAVDVVDTYERLIAAGQQSGELRDDLASSHLAVLFHHLHLGALLRWLTVPGLALHEEFRVAIDLFVTGTAQRTTHQALAASRKRPRRRP